MILIVPFVPTAQAGYKEGGGDVSSPRVLILRRLIMNHRSWGETNGGLPQEHVPSPLLKGQHAGFYADGISNQ